MITFDNFEKVLKSVGGEFCDVDDIGFSRRIAVDCLGTKVVFEWFKNLCNAYIGDIEVCWFDDITVDGCFPNRFKRNINVVKNGTSIAIFPIERYKK